MEVKPGLIPDAWGVKKLRDICGRVTTGKLDANAMVANGDYPFFTCASEPFRINQYAFDCEALLVSGNGANVGYVHYYNGKFNAYQRTYVISEFSADVQFLKLFLERNLHERIRVEVNAGNTPYITMGTLTEMEVYLPESRDEQYVIAEALSDAEALLGALDKLIAKKRDLKQAAMQQLLTGQTRLPGYHGEWAVKKLGELLDYEQPTKYLVKNSEYSDDNDVPVLTAGKTFILGYTNEENGIFTNLPAIIFDDFTTATKYVTFPFKAKSSAMKILKPRNVTINLKLVFEIIQSIQFKLSDHKRYWISEYQHIQVKFPDEKEQTAIAEVLSDMDAELAALEQRRAKTHALKQGMMQELLTGKTRLL